jgi:hypothetical protein
MKLIDISGKVFGEWTVLRKEDGNGARWVVQCSCGSKPRIMTSKTIRLGNSKSCGHAKAETMRKMRAAQPKLSKSQVHMHLLTNSRIYNAQIKLECLTHYGPDSVLQCSALGCVVADPDMLSLDHISNNGAEDRRVGRGYSGVALYGQLKREGYPTGFSTLCCNHQMKKELLRRRIEWQTQETQLCLA